MKAISRSTGLTRRHKNLIHGVVLIVIGLSLIIEGGSTADWAFLALSVVSEVS